MTESPTARQLRIKRLEFGHIAYAVMTGVVLLVWRVGHLQLEHVLVFCGALFAVQLAFDVMLRSRKGDQLSDHRMTAAGILLPGLVFVYLMYQVDSSAVRFLFLLMGLATVQFAAFSNNARTMAGISAGLVFYDVVLIALLAIFAPERMTLHLELLALITYAITLACATFLTSFIGRLRLRLIDKNRELSVLTRQLKELATRDSLTGLRNRHAALTILSEADMRPGRHPERGQGLQSLALMDMDNFKSLNDQFGHHFGDAALKTVATALKRSLRLQDIAVRWGGEEFLIIFPGTSASEAGRACERMRKTLADLRFSEQPAVRLSGSFGIVEYRYAEQWKAALKQADQALYAAKAAGRNCVELHPTASQTWHPSAA